MKYHINKRNIKLENQTEKKSMHYQQEDANFLIQQKNFNQSKQDNILFFGDNVHSEKQFVKKKNSNVSLSTVFKSDKTRYNKRFISQKNTKKLDIIDTKKSFTGLNMNKNNLIKYFQKSKKPKIVEEVINDKEKLEIDLCICNSTPKKDIKNSTGSKEIGSVGQGYQKKILKNIKVFHNVKPIVFEEKIIILEDKNIIHSNISLKK